MDSISTIFIDNPQITVDISQKTASISGKTETSSITATGVKMLLFNGSDKYLQDYIPGIDFVGYIDKNLIPNIVLSAQDRIISGPDKYEIEGVPLLQNESPDIFPFWKIRLKKTTV